MKKFLLTLCALYVCVVPAQASDGLLAGAKLKQAISGRTVYLHTPVGALPIRYSASGSMAGASSAHLASLAGESVTKDRGRWWVTGSQLCQKWQSWMEGRTYCYQLRKSGGGNVHWRRNDGRSGTARIG